CGHFPGSAGNELRDFPIGRRDSTIGTARFDCDLYVLLSIELFPDVGACQACCSSQNLPADSELRSQQDDDKSSYVVSLAAMKHRTGRLWVYLNPAAQNMPKTDDTIVR